MALTIGEYLGYLLGNRDPKQALPWPPDVFACTAALLAKSGAYRRLVGGPGLLGPDWVATATRLGQHWRATLNVHLQTAEDVTDLEGYQPPVEVQAWWATLVAGSGNTVEGVDNQDALVQATLGLCLVADEASTGFGIEVEDNTEGFVEYVVLPGQEHRSLCIAVDPEKVRVLPKQHTPQRGLTIRSLSHHLALCPASEVTARWIPPWHSVRDAESGNVENYDPFNALLFPWPFFVSPRHFTLESAASEAAGMPARFGLFGYQRESMAGKLHEYLEKTLQEALRVVRRVDAIILPEAALTAEELTTAEGVCLQRDILLITGSSAPGLAGEAPSNDAIVQPAGFVGLRALADDLRVRQPKHHRWCLDHGQILQYGLGGVLPASRDLWEYIRIPNRQVHFITPHNWLTMCVLVCEDLARQDPVPDVIRAVGPNLVVALLMDGPQLRNRWPSRYASVLAEDPGSSVLTMTSLGMARMSRPRSDEEDKSRTIALWRDAHKGERELVLPPGKDAAVLSLTCKSVAEYTADGRADNGEAHFPVFAGFHPLDWTAT